MNEALSIDDLKTIVEGKKVYIWGSMIVGQGVCRALERHNIPVSGFVDSSCELQGTLALGYAINEPASIQKEMDEDCAIVIISSGHYDTEIKSTCLEMNFKEHQLVLSRSLNDIDPSIDISGTCNLHCISCPMGNMTSHHESGFMTPEVYGTVLDKLLKERPLIGSIQLYTWGEPFLNKELPAIIEKTKREKVLVAISTNLNAGGKMEAVVKAKPDWIKISTSGFGENYEITHTGGKWERFYKNIVKLSELRKKYHPDMHVMVNYHLYNHNQGEDYKKMQEFCREHDFAFRPNYAYLYSMDNVMDMCEGKPLNPMAEKTLQYLDLDMEQAIKLAKEQKHMACPEETCLPISWDLKVRFCGVYYKPFIHDNFMDASIDDIMKDKLSSSFCAKCKSHGLHRLTGVYIEEKVLQSNDDTGGDA